MLKDDVKAIVQDKISNLAGGADMIEEVVDETEQVILNYCNIKSVPAGLKYTWARMAVDLLRYDYAVAHPPQQTAGEMAVGGVISSIKELDTMVEFKGKTDAQRIWSDDYGSHQARLDSLILEYKGQLVTYRKLRW